MSRVLVIDDDVGTLVGYKGVLRAAGHEVTTAALGEDGLALIERDEFDIVLCDQRLPDRPGLDVVRQIRQTCPGSAVVLVTGWGTPELVIEAERAGATSYAEKPLLGDDLISVVYEALRLRVAGSPPPADPVGYAARRWVEVVVHGASLEEDPKTILAWCKGIAMSHATLQKRCDAVGVTPKASHDFMRLLHVVLHHGGEAWNLQRGLNIVDDRTTCALRQRAGFGSMWRRVPDLERFLAYQRSVTRSELVEAVRARLLRRPFHSPHGAWGS